MSEQWEGILTGGDVFALFGLGSSPEPPVSVPLGILELDGVPGSRETLQSAFRARVIQIHPDINDVSALVHRHDPTVQELVWARNVLQRKIPLDRYG